MIDMFLTVYLVTTSVATICVAGVLLFDFWATFWPAVNGKVASFSCRVSAGTPRMSTEIHYCKISYQYSYNSRVYFGSGFSSIGDLVTVDVDMASIYKERYARGRDVKVHVCPIFPRLSFVAPYLHKNPFTYIFLLISMTFLTAGIMASS